MAKKPPTKAAEPAPAPTVVAATEPLHPTKLTYDDAETLFDNSVEELRKVVAGAGDRYEAALRDWRDHGVRILKDVAAGRLPKSEIGLTFEMAKDSLASRLLVGADQASKAARQAAIDATFKVISRVILRV